MDGEESESASSVINSNGNISHSTECSIPTADDDDQQRDSSSESVKTGLCSMSRDKKFTVITFCFANFCFGAFYSLLAPFFPQEAAAKQVSSTVTGLIFGSFELVFICFSPLFGNYLTHFGAKFLYCTGVMVCASTTIMFGFLDLCPPGTLFIVMCFVVRFFEGIGAAASATASFAIMANTFPDNVASMFGSLEMFSGLGMMVGPPIGGALYQLGGFRLPFILMGSLLMLVGISSYFLLPVQQDVTGLTKKSIFSLLRLPLVIITSLLLVIGAGSIGFLDVTLSLFLAAKYHLSPVILGLVFIVGPGVYAFTAPIWGYIADKKPYWSGWVICVGYLIGGVAFVFMGPAPFLPIADDLLWLILVCLGFMGLGIGTIVVAFQIFTTAARDAGHVDSLDTFGLISGIFNMFFSIGAFIGPLGGGALHDFFGFGWSSAIFGFLAMFGSLLLAVYLLITRRVKAANRHSKDLSTSSSQERQPLLGKSQSNSNSNAAVEA